MGVLSWSLLGVDGVGAVVTFFLIRLGFGCVRDGASVVVVAFDSCVNGTVVLSLFSCIRGGKLLSSMAVDSGDGDSWEAVQTVVAFFLCCGGRVTRVNSASAVAALSLEGCESLLVGGGFLVGESFVVFFVVVEVIFRGVGLSELLGGLG